MNVKEILIEYLKANGFDGLCNDEECGCWIDDDDEFAFMLCDGPVDSCVPGRKIPCPEQPECDCRGFHVVTEKPEKTDEENGN